MPEKPNIPSGEFHIYRTNGEVDIIKEKPTIPRLHELTGASYFDTVNLRNGSVMMVDDNGIAKGLPVNAKATEVYHMMCVPGTTHKIQGDAVIVNDSDFGGAEDEE